jgi:hypothetical protein
MMNYGKIITIARIAVLASVALCSPAWAAVNVTLEVDDSVNPPQLVVVNNNAQCSGGPIDCIEVAHGDQPHMFFRLNRACQPGGPEWGLSRFYVMQYEKNWPAALPSDIAQEFCANERTGEVSSSRCDNQARDNQLQIKNYNRSSRSVYYMVEAKHCTDSSRAPIGLDPEIRNRGGGN